MTRNLIFIALTAIILQSCALQVNLMNPQPNLNLDETKEKLALVIDESIKDVFVLPQQNGIKQSNVTEWHNSLKYGFNNGFEDYYTIVDNKSDADLILELSRTDIEFVPAAVSGYYGVVAINAQIIFKAKLMRRNGEVINKNAGTSVSKSATNQPTQITQAVESAVESMYEIIGAELFIN